ncbi:MAG: SpoIIE family protein phosphatase, partial [Moraxellaceae bacterium]
AGGEMGPVPSRHLPLGVLAPAAFRYQPEQLALLPGDCLCLWSDGLVERAAPGGERFGEARLRAVLARRPADVVGALVAAVQAFSGEAGAEDDCSLVAITALAASTPPPAPARPAQGACSWSWEGRDLCAADPAAVVMAWLHQWPALQDCLSPLATVVGELCNNALEHGVLGLASHHKCDADGFAGYYAARAARLATLETGWLRIRAEVQAAAGAVRVVLAVQDSGHGFDTEAWPAGCPPYAGRGLGLLASLCRRVEYLPPGNHAIAEFTWPHTGSDTR